MSYYSRSWRPPGRPLIVDREQLITLVFDHIDHYGFRTLTLKVLGERLGVGPSAFYWHIGGRPALMAIAATSLMERVTPCFDRDWRLAAETECSRLATVIADQRDAAPLLREAPQAVFGSRTSMRITSRLKHAGLTHRQATDITRMLLTHITTDPAEDQSALDFLLDGVATHLAEPHPAPL